MERARERLWRKNEFSETASAAGQETSRTDKGDFGETASAAAEDLNKYPAWSGRRIERPGCFSNYPKSEKHFEGRKR